ncbi:MAG: isoprenylcysteine carboxylmethyltransferase family protein [Anaerolineales bacterium]
MKSPTTYIIALLAGMLIFVGLPLLGWGSGTLSTFFENPVRIAYIVVIFGLQIFALLYNPQVGRNQENRKSGITTPKLDLILIQVFSLAIVILAPYSDRHSFSVFASTDLLRYIGLVLVIPGFILMQAGEKHLAKQFSIQVTLQEDHKLIQSGPYKVIRHPRYLGIVTFFLGISFVFRSLLTTILVIVLAAILIWRIFTEENLLHQEFGTAWETYCKTSWRLIPFIF